MTQTVSMRNIVIDSDSNPGVDTLKLVNGRVDVSADGKNVEIYAHGYQLVKTLATGEAPQQGVVNYGNKKVVLNGITVEQAPDSHLIITLPEDTKFVAHRAASQPVVGELTRDGIFIGTSEDKNGVKKAWFADLNDGQDGAGKRLSATFNEAAAYAAERNEQKYLNHNDWVVAPIWSNGLGGFDTLSTLFKNQAKVGGFDPKADYWSSSPVFTRDSNFKQSVDFKTGKRGSSDENTRKAFRLVRSVTL